MTSRAKDEWLLTGHFTDQYVSYSSHYGIYHLGPFFLYIWVLGEWLVGGFTKTLLAAQMIATMACNAAFAGLAATMVQRLAEGEGADRRHAAAMAVLCAAITIVVSSARGSLANPWVPVMVQLPFLVFSLSALATWRGDCLGLIVMTFAAAALGHGYIPTIPAVVPLWSLSVAMGWRFRTAACGHGFPAWVWGAVILIIGIFATPLVADMILNPPGNPVRVIEAGLNHSPTMPTPSVWDVAKGIFGISKNVGWWIWIAAVAGFGISVRTGTCRNHFINGMYLLLLTIAISFLFFLHTPAPVKGFELRFLVGAFAVLPLIGLVTLSVHATRSRWPATERWLPMGGWVAAAALLILVSAQGNARWNRTPNSEIGELAALLVADTPEKEEIALITPKRQGESQPWTALGVAAGIAIAMDDLDRRACFLNAEYGYIVTAKRLCQSAPPPASRRLYQITQMSPEECPSAKTTGSLVDAVRMRYGPRCLWARAVSR